MDRLTTRSSLCDGCPKEDWCHQYCFESELYERLAHYEGLEEQGRLVELPCKRGEKAYYITQNLEGETIIASGIFHLAWLDYYEYIFATKEEAEAKLEEKGGGSDE